VYVPILPKIVPEQNMRIIRHLSSGWTTSFSQKDDIFNNKYVINGRRDREEDKLSIFLQISRIMKIIIGAEPYSCYLYD
jgi:hypothetical protein